MNAKDPIKHNLDMSDMVVNSYVGDLSDADFLAVPVPGMNHCSGGPATDTYDSLQTMVDWVEKGVAPDSIAARASATNAYFPNRTRPLCAYPKFAKYKGSGSIEDAVNFSCVAE